MHFGSETWNNIARPAVIRPFIVTRRVPIGRGGRDIGMDAAGIVKVQQGREGRTGGGGKVRFAPKVGANILGSVRGGTAKERHGCGVGITIRDLYRQNLLRL